MPQVGKKHFGYGPKGKAAAKKEAKRTGKKVVHKKNPGYIVAHTTYKRFASVLFEDAKKKAEDADALRKARVDSPDAPEWARRLTQPRGETPVAKRKRLFAAAQAKAKATRKTEAYRVFGKRLNEALPFVAALGPGLRAAAMTAGRVGSAFGKGVSKIKDFDKVKDLLKRASSRRRTPEEKKKELEAQKENAEVAEEETKMNYKNTYVRKLMEAGKGPRKAGLEAAEREQAKQAAQGTGVDNPKTFRAYKRARIKAGGKHREAGGVPATETPQQKAALGAEDVKKRSGK